MPMFFSIYQGGMAPALSRIAVRAFIERAHGLASSYVRSDIGATWPGRWQFWQLRCRIGAMSLVNVTSGTAAGAACCALIGVTYRAAPNRAVPANSARPKFFPTAIVNLLKSRFKRPAGDGARTLWEGSILPLRPHDGRAVPLRNLPYWYTSNFLQSCSIHDTYGVVAGRRDVGELAVGRQRHPLGMLPDVHMSDGFEVGQRVAIHGAVNLARGEQELAVGRDREAMHRRALESLGVPGLAGDRRRFESRDLLALLEVDDGDAVVIGQLDEDTRRRSVRGLLERHRPDPGRHLQLPCNLFRGLIDHRDHAI